MVLLRRYTYEDTGDDAGSGEVKLAVNELYPCDFMSSGLPQLDAPQIREALLAIAEDQVEKPQEEDPTDGNMSKRQAKAKQKAKKKQKKKGSDLNLKVLFSKKLGLAPDIVEHCLLKGGFKHRVSLSDLGWTADGSEWQPKEEDVNKLVTAFEEAHHAQQRLSSEASSGYIVVRRKVQTGSKPKQDAKKSEENGDVADKEEAPKATDVYSEFLPTLLEQHTRRMGSYGDENCRFEELPTFNLAMDEYFSKIEVQKAELRHMKEEAAAWRKVERVKEDHLQRVEMLKQMVHTNERKAQLIEMNVFHIQNAIDAIMVEVARGTDWNELASIVKEQQECGNPVANSIHQLQLHENTITMLLSESMNHIYPKELDDDEGLFDDSDDEEAEDDEEEKNSEEAEEEDEVVKVVIDLDLTPYANAAAYYNKKKSTVVKAEKTIEASEKAVKAAERRTEQALKQVVVKHSIQQIRKTHWFEKFHWFISSENYLVVGGKSAQENELLVKRHLGKNDIYVHGDFHGGSSVVVKNPSGGPIPPKTLEQAGSMCVCRSVAWDSKVANNAYWVHADQVSKTAPTGEYLPTGSFMVRGKRNYLNSNQLVMSFGLLFCVGEASLAKHVGERRPKVFGDDDDDDTNDEEKGAVDRAAPTAATASSSSATPAAASTGKRSSTAKVQNSDHDKEAEESSDDDDGLGLDVTSQLVRLTSVSSQKSFGSALNEEENNAAWARLRSRSQRSENSGDEDGGEDESNQDGVSVASDESRVSDATSTTSKHQGKKKLSKAERRRLKKYGTLELPEEVKKSKQKQELQASKKNAKKKAAGASAPQPKLSRGKRAKMKQLKKKGKYQEQDAEDLAIAKQLLGLEVTIPEENEGDEVSDKGTSGKKGADKKTDDNKDGDDDNDDNDDENDDAVDGDKRCFECGETTHLFKDCPNRKDGAGFAQARKRHQAAEASEIAQILEEENIVSVDGENVTELDMFTGIPNDDDELLYAMVMCAPVNAMSNYRFKVKLVPGGGKKKGRVIKSALEIFYQNAPPQLVDLMKGIPEGEPSRVMIGNCKLSTSSSAKKGGKPKGGKKPRKQQGKVKKNQK